MGLGGKLCKITRHTLKSHSANNGRRQLNRESTFRSRSKYTCTFTNCLQLVHLMYDLCTVTSTSQTQGYLIYMLSTYIQHYCSFRHKRCHTKTWLSYQEVELMVLPVTTGQDCPSTFVNIKPPDIDIYCHEVVASPAVFVVIQECLICYLPNLKLKCFQKSWVFCHVDSTCEKKASHNWTSDIFKTEIIS